MDLTKLKIGATVSWTEWGTTYTGVVDCVLEPDHLFSAAQVLKYRSRNITPEFKFCGTRNAPSAIVVGTYPTGQKWARRPFLEQI